MSSRITALVLLGCATAASACSSCSAPAGEEGTATRWAYYGTAIFLTLLPGLLLGSLLVWLRRQGTPSHRPGSAEIGHPATIA